MQGKVKRALKHGDRVKARVSIELSDQAGNKRTVNRVVRIK